MLSTIDFEKLLFLYKTEGQNMSIHTFCVNKGYQLQDDPRLAGHRLKSLQLYSERKIRNTLKYR